MYFVAHPWEPPWLWHRLLDTAVQILLLKIGDGLNLIIHFMYSIWVNGWLMTTGSRFNHILECLKFSLNGTLDILFISFIWIFLL